MIRILLISCLFVLPCLGQTTTGNAQTSGPCSPSVSGNNNRIITNCEGAGKEKVEAPAFHEKTGEVTFLFGAGGPAFTQSMEQLRKGKSQPFLIGNYVPLTFRMDGDTLLFSFKLWSASGIAPVEVENNEFRVGNPRWDWNYTANALEVVDEKLVPIFQMIRKAPFQIVINGLFPTPTGLMFANEKGLGFRSKREIPPDFILKPIFKYPAWKYPGQYADIQEAPETLPKSAEGDIPEQANPNIHIEQHSEGNNSPNIVAGPNAQVTVNPEVNPNTPQITYSKNGYMKSVQGMNFGVSQEAEVVYRGLVDLFTRGQWNELIQQCEAQIKERPEWFTPYAMAGIAYANLGNKAKAITLLEAAKTGMTGSQDYEPLPAVVDKLIKQLNAEP